VLAFGEKAAKGAAGGLLVRFRLDDDDVAIYYNRLLKIKAQ
jgi:hypothetical protein